MNEDEFLGFLPLFMETADQVAAVHSQQLLWHVPFLEVQHRPKESYLAWGNVTSMTAFVFEMTWVLLHLTS